MADATRWDHVTASLVDRARSRDEAAWTSLFDRIRAPLRRVASIRLMQAGLVARTDPDDVIQETFIVAFRRLNDFEDRGPGSFRVWLERIASNIVREWHRNYKKAKKRSHVSEAADLDLREAAALSPADDVAGRWMTDLVVRAVAALPEPEATLISYRVYLGLTWEELAEAMTTPADGWTTPRARYQVNAAIGMVTEALVKLRSASAERTRSDGR